MGLVVSFREQKWRALLASAIAHGEAPGRAAAELMKARKAVRGLPVPELADLKLFTSLAWLCEAYAEADHARRLSLSHYLVGLAAYCQDTLEPPAPQPETARAVGEPYWLKGD